MNATLDHAPPRDLDRASIGVGQAPAKVILVGEHAVVYGAPALAIPVPELHVRVRAAAAPETFLESHLYSGAVSGAPARLAPVVTAITASLDHVRSRLLQANGQLGARVRIDSKIPPDRGLGSSAAVAAAIAEAVVGAYGLTLTAEAQFDIAQKAERRAHGTPSGLDARTVLARGPIRFQEGQVHPLSLAGGLTFVLADSGVSGSTASAVAGVRAMHETDVGAVDGIVDSLAGLATEAELALGTGDAPAVGASMSAAHEQLRRLGVSIPELDHLVAAAQRAGALGAKLTGGGLGGCVLALAASTEDARTLAHAMRAAGAHSVWTTHPHGP